MTAADSPPRRPRARPSAGQHYLTDGATLSRIAEAAAPGPEDTVIEVGAGPGNMTRRLAATGARVVAVEMDSRFSAGLSHLQREFPHLTFTVGDILALDWETLWGDAPPAHRVLAGNLPYQITSPLLARMSEARTRFARAVIMLQREVAERLVAPPGTRTRGALTVKMALDFEAAMLFRVGRRAFRPRPAVDSAVVRLTPLASPPVADEASRAQVRRLVEAAFGAKRQQMINSLTRHWTPRCPKADWADRLAQAGIEPTRRAEQIALADFLALARRLPGPEKSLAKES